jgi:hypothetical protein
MSLEAAVPVDPSGATARERVDAMSVQQIEQRRTEILNKAAGDYEKNLTTDDLHELAYIASRLRKTQVGPPKEKAPVKAKAPKTIADLL